MQESDPEFLSKLVLYGLTRHSIYQQLRQVAPHLPASAPGPEESSPHGDHAASSEV